jgi:quinol monooxygenase YgiN
MPTDTPFRVQLTMQVDPANAAEFEAAWLAVGQTVAEHPSNIAQWFARSRGNPGTYYIVSDWPDEETFRRFEKEPGHWEITGQLRKLRVAGDMTTVDVLHHLPGAAT